MVKIFVGVWGGGSVYWASNRSTVHVACHHIVELTLGSRLHGDLVAEVTSARGGDGCGPDQILLPVVEVGDPVEQKLWICFIFAGHLRRTERIQKGFNLGGAALGT